MAKMHFLFILIQYLVPQHLLSRLAGRIASTRTAWLKNAIIRWFIRRYSVNMAEALHENADDYASFNDFFSRALKEKARPIDDGDDILVSPADGVISAIGDIANDLFIQTKGKHFELLELVGGDTEIAEVFREGSFVTVYLSPKDYHRVHMPLAGTLRKMVYVPGKLFSVNQTTSERIHGLFARNERAICIFDTDMGPLAVILVGAMIVAGIDTVWSGQITPAKHGLSVEDYSSQHPAIQLGKGEELGRFRLGSTVILLAGPGALDWAEGFVENSAVQMGSMLAKLR